MVHMVDVYKHCRHHIMSWQVYACIDDGTGDKNLPQNSQKLGVDRDTSKSWLSISIKTLKKEKHVLTLVENHDIM